MRSLQPNDIFGDATGLDACGKLRIGECSAELGGDAMRRRCLISAPAGNGRVTDLRLMDAIVCINSYATRKKTHGKPES